ncbi:cell wall protein RBR3-like [Tachysurus fulvidraco]|uniref:cell wall protein RBR3-like n=1 Tax=Tachysurus fulvidraco TaxID=1234273 RepID=UPI001FEF9ADD|nr:cell wall protein RBR3-like [Tachysurus fulvidraco]
MSWIMKRLHLIFIALVLWGNANRFGVWNRTFVVGWQAVDFNTTGDQNFQLATRVQPFELLARKSANGNAVGGNSESLLLASEVQTAQHDSSFVQSSVENSNSQAATTNQNQDKAEVSTSKIYWFDSLKTESTGTLLSQAQSAATPNLAYGSQTHSTYEAHSTIPVSASTSQAQSVGASTLYQGLTSGRYLPPLSQSIPSSSQSVVSTNQITGFPNQTSYQPSTTTQVSAGQSVSTAQAQSTLYQGLTSGRYLPSLNQSIPYSAQSVASTNQMSGFHWPSTTTQVSAGQSASSQAQSMGASTLYHGLTSGRYLPPLNQSIPSSSQSVVSENPIFGFQNQTSYQPSTTTQVSAGQSVSVSQVQGSYGAETSGHTKWYNILPGQTIPSSSQVSEIQRQSLNLPSSAPVWAGQSTSTSQAQSTGASTLYHGLTSGRYLPSLNQSIPYSSQSVANTNQMSGFHWPSTTTRVSAGQAASFQAQSVGASTLYQGLTSGRYLPSLSQSIPSSSQSVVSTNQITGFPNQTSYQPSTTTQVSAGQSVSTAQAQSMGASTLYQGLTSGRYLPPLSQSIPSSSQSVVSENPIFGFQNQTSYQPSTTTQVSAGQSVSVSQVQGSYGAETSGHTKWYNILPGQTIPSSSQVSEIQRQSLNLPSSAPVWAGQSTSTSQAQSMGASTLYHGLTSGRYLPSLNQSIPYSAQSVASTNQMSGFHWPSTTTQVSAGQSASSQAQSMGASTLYQGLTSGRYLPSLDQSIPSSSQSVVSENPIFGFQNQNSYRPSTTTQVLAGQSVSTSQAQSMGASTLYQGLTSGRYLPSLDQSISSSSQSVDSTNQISGFNQPSTTTAVSAGQTAFTSQSESIGGLLGQGLTSGRYLTSLAQSIPSSSQSVVSTNRISGWQNQMTYQPSTTTQDSDANSVSISHGSNGAETSGHANWYTSLPGQTLASSSQASEIQKPSLNPLIAKQLWAGQSVSISQAPFQHTLPQ